VQDNGVVGAVEESKDVPISQEDLAKVMAAVHACRVREEALACELASQPQLQGGSGDAPVFDTCGEACDDHQAEGGNAAKTRPLQHGVNNHHATAGEAGAKPRVDASQNSGNFQGADAADAKGGTDGMRTDSMSGSAGHRRFGAADAEGHADGLRLNSTVGSQGSKRIKGGADVKRPQHPRAPGLISVGSSQKMVAERRAAVFGSDDTSTFEELGLSKVHHLLVHGGEKGCCYYGSPVDEWCGWVTTLCCCSLPSA
jgi:hypothetical protein